MTQLLVLIGFCMVAMTLMAFGLHISRYKKRGTGCGENCSCYGEKSAFVDGYNDACKNK